MRVSFLCPFNLNRPTGTPSRARTTITAASLVGEVHIISNTKGCTFFAFTRRALALLKDQKPDVIHGVTSVSVPAFLLYRYFFSPRVHLVFEMHGWAWAELAQEHKPFTRFALLLFDIVGLNCAHAVIVMSHTQKEFVSRWTFNSGRILVLWGPVDSLPPFISASHEGPLVVGYLGNSSWWQGLHYLLNAAVLLKDDSSFTFRLAGFNTSELENFPHIPSIQYQGILKESEVLPFWRGCNVLISPRLPGVVSNLQFPHKLSGYLSAGRPVIVSSTNDQAHIVREAQCGLVVDPLNAESLAQALKEFAQLSQEEQQKMGERASHFAHKHFSPEILVTTLKKLYVVK